MEQTTIEQTIDSLSDAVKVVRSLELGELEDSIVTNLIRAKVDLRALMPQLVREEVQ